MVRRNYSFTEDELLEPTIEALARVHEFEKWSVKQHVVVDGREVDALLYWRTPGGVERRAVIELKNNDIVGVARQIIKRRHLAHYAYMAVGVPPHVLLRVLISKGLIGKIKELGVGVVSVFSVSVGRAHGRGGIVLLKSRLTPQSFLDYLLEREER